MPFDNIDRLDRERAEPRVLALHFAMARLRSVVSFMNTGAHPDDETSSMLAAIGFRDGLDLSYACANRGEGGQNDIGTESMATLGTLRTAEMEAAARMLDLRLYWLSQSPEDSIVDFGFSKSGVETLGKWTYERSLQRFVSVVRQERPDIICPTFLDIPGQHGHHRAMTALAHDVFDRAADPDYQSGQLSPWQIKKLYLPAWGGGGTAYDDEDPPPQASLHIPADGCDALSSWTWAHIGEHSRRFHRTQGMGYWVAAGDERNWPLHLARSALDTPDTDLCSGLATTLGSLAHWCQARHLIEPLNGAQTAIDAAFQAFPHAAEVAKQCSIALQYVRRATQDCPDHATAEVLHRLARKETQLSRVIRLASGVSVRVWANQDVWRPGDTSKINTELRRSDVDCDVTFSLTTQAPWSVHEDQLHLHPSASVSDPYPDTYYPDTAPLPALQLSLTIEGIESTSLLPLESPPVVLPSRTATVTPSKMLINTALPVKAIDIRIHSRVPEQAQATLQLPANWTADAGEQGFHLSPPEPLDEGLYELAVLLDDQPASQTTLIDYPHITPRAISIPATIKLRAMAIALPEVKLAYIGGGSDSINMSLRAMGLDVIDVTDQHLRDADTLQALLSQVDTLVVGLFAYRSRPAFARLNAVVHEWINSGGHVLTLYHRPWDNWDPQTTPPRRLDIGQPSLRFRVTDETATVTHLLPEHPLLNSPNTIDEDDWSGWHKERGLYFAKSWDPAYAALLSMADPGEQAQLGALLSAEIGRGRHTHTSLILHHQVNQLVPGGFRLLANLVA